MNYTFYIYWIKLAKKKDYKSIMMDTCNKTYTKNLLLNRLTTRIISLFNVGLTLFNKLFEKTIDMRLKCNFMLYETIER